MVNKNILMFMLVMCLIVGCGGSVLGATINAVSCEQVDVQAAIDSAVDGDTVLVPAGECIWLSGVSFTKAIIIKGAGIDQTIIIRKGIYSNAIFASINFNHNLPIRITGFTFNGNNETMALFFKSIIGNIYTELRIDHCKFVNCISRAILLDNCIYGVINNNIFQDIGSSAIAVYGDSAASWTRGVNLGSADAIYVENNLFNYTGNGLDPEHAITSNDGARYVFRYNTMICHIRSAGYHFAAPIDAHGQCFGSLRGTFSYEIYENIIDVDGYRGMFIRGGTGVIFNNTFIQAPDRHISLTNYRSHNETCGYNCGGIESSQCCVEEEYPCADQINNLYIWNNGIGVTPLVEIVGYNTIHIQENRDYYNDLQKPGYTPYTYPHPLTIETTLTCTDAGGTCQTNTCDTYTDCTSLTGTCVTGYCCSGTCTASTTTCSPADTDTDGVVSILEIMAYITEWKAGNVDIVSLMTGITEWKSGCT